MNSNIPIEQHPLRPFLLPNAQLLMLGSFPPPQARWSMDFFYPNLQNDMWRIMGEVFYGDKHIFLCCDGKRFNKPAIIEMLTNKGIAIYDTAVSVRRLKGNASDALLEVVTPTDIKELLSRMPYCNAIATTGEKATQVVTEMFGTSRPVIGAKTSFLFQDRTIDVFRMPSTSRAYPLRLETKASYYQRMFCELGLL